MLVLRLYGLESSNIQHLRKHIFNMLNFHRGLAYIKQSLYKDNFFIQICHKKKPRNGIGQRELPLCTLLGHYDYTTCISFARGSLQFITRLLF